MKRPLNRNYLVSIKYAYTIYFSRHKLILCFLIICFHHLFKVGETKIKFKGMGQVRKDSMEKEEKIQQKFFQEIEKLDKDILRSTELLRSSREFMPPSSK